MFNPLGIATTLDVALVSTVIGEVTNLRKLILLIMALLVGGSSTTTLSVLVLARQKDLEWRSPSSVYLCILIFFVCFILYSSSTQNKWYLVIGFLVENNFYGHRDMRSS